MEPVVAFPVEGPGPSGPSYTASYLRLHGDTILYVLFDPKDPTDFYELSEDAVQIREREGYRKWDLEEICRRGYLELARFMVERGAEQINQGLRGACEGGHMELVKLMMENGATHVGWGLQGACRSNNPEMIELMKQVGVEHQWVWGAHGACEGGHEQLAREMIDRTTATTPFGHLFALLASIKRGDVELLERLFRDVLKGPVLKNGDAWRDWRISAFRAAYEGGYPEMIEFMDKTFPRRMYTDDYVDAVAGWCKGGRPTLPIHLAMKNWSSSDMTSGIIHGGCLGGHKYIIDSVRENGNFDKYLASACEGGHMDIIQFIARKEGYAFQSSNLNEGLQAALDNGHMNIVRFMLSGYLGKVDASTINPTVAIQRGFVDIAMLLVDRGMNPKSSNLMDLMVMMKNDAFSFHFDNKFPVVDRWSKSRYQELSKILENYVPIPDVVIQYM
jgi:ankyrin repeat protein